MIPPDFSLFYVSLNIMAYVTQAASQRHSLTVLRSRKSEAGPPPCDNILSISLVRSLIELVVQKLCRCEHGVRFFPAESVFILEHYFAYK